MQTHGGAGGTVLRLAAQGEVGGGPLVLAVDLHEPAVGAVQVEGAGRDVDADAHLLGLAVDCAAGQAQPGLRGVGDVQGQVDLDRAPRAQSRHRVGGLEAGEVGGPPAQGVELGDGFLHEGALATDGGQGQLARDAHLTAPVSGRQRVGVVPVAQPGQPHAAALDVLEALGGVEVLADVGESGVAVLGEEDGAVEVADEVLGGGAGRLLVGSHREGHDPAGAPVAGVGQGEEVGALPYGGVRADALAEVAGVSPGLEVGGAEEGDVVPGGDDHDPGLGVLVPEDLGVAEVLAPVVGDDGVAGEALPGTAPVGGVGQGLGLSAVGGGVDGDQAAAGDQAGGVGPVHDAAAGHGQALRVVLQGRPLALPVHHVRADRVAPGAVLLVEEVVLALVEDQAVGVGEIPRGGAVVVGGAVGGRGRRVGGRGRR